MSIFINTDSKVTAVIESCPARPPTDQPPRDWESGHDGRQVAELTPPSPDLANLSPIPRPSKQGGSGAGLIHTSSPIPTPPPPELTPAVSRPPNSELASKIRENIKAEKDSNGPGPSGSGHTQGEGGINSPPDKQGEDSGPDSSSGSESESPADSNLSLEGTWGGDHRLFRALCWRAQFKNYCHACTCKQRCFLWHGFQGALRSSHPSYILTLPEGPPCRGR